MKANSDVVVVGSLHLDILVQASHLPAIDETARGSGWKKICGGKGGNQACWSSRLGARTAMISRIGRDDFGHMLLANLKACGVHAGCVSVDASADSGMSVAIADKDGGYGAVIVSGANLLMKPQKVAQDMRKLGASKLLLLQNEVAEKINTAAAREAKKSGAMVILNAAPARQVPPSLARLVDILVVNRVEASMLAGRKSLSRQSALASIPHLLKLCPTVIVTLGADGLVLAKRGARHHAIKAHKVKARSTHGAGDCFMAALAASLAKGAPLLAAAKRANHAAATFVSGKQPKL